MNMTELTAGTGSSYHDVSMSALGTLHPRQTRLLTLRDLALVRQLGVQHDFNLVSPNRT